MIDGFWSIDSNLARRGAHSTGELSPPPLKNCKTSGISDMISSWQHLVVRFGNAWAENEREQQSWDFINLNRQPISNLATAELLIARSDQVLNYLKNFCSTFKLSAVL